MKGQVKVIFKLIKKNNRNLLQSDFRYKCEFKKDR